MQAPIRDLRPKLPMPSGWFRIATTDELPRGGVGVFKINGQEVVAFRARACTRSSDSPAKIRSFLGATGLTLPWRAATYAQMRVIHRYVIRDVLEDKEIWEHRVPMDAPALIPGDGPIAKFRRWVKQFYA